MIGSAGMFLRLFSSQIQGFNWKGKKRQASALDTLADMASRETAVCAILVEHKSGVSEQRPGTLSTSMAGTALDSCGIEFTIAVGQAVEAN